MLNYWDLPERDRAKLTEQQLEEFVASECMQKGVLRAKPLELVPEPEMPEPDVEAFVLKVGYHSTVAFGSAEAAQEALSRATATIESAYINGSHVDHLQPLRDIAVEHRRVYSAAQLAACRAAIERATAAKKENEMRRSNWEKANKAESEALQGLYSDWHECGRKAARMQRVADTFRDYCKTAGDAHTAAKFLLKVFSREDITEAAEWCGVDMPLPAIDVEAPDPRPTAAVIERVDDSGVPF